MIIALVIREAIMHRRLLMRDCLAEIIACSDQAALSVLMEQGRRLAAEVEELEQHLKGLS